MKLLETSLNKLKLIWCKFPKGFLVKFLTSNIPPTKIEEDYLENIFIENN